MEYTQITTLAKQLKENIGKVIVGKDTQVELMLTALLAGGHVLLEDVPGTGKTTMAKALAKSLTCAFARVQFTPDLLPADITGTRIYNQKSGEFTFIKGPAFTNILLADEINRATPRTQAALLECMEERQISEGGITYNLEAPFLVIATQNPVETQGTFPLPEAQLDRFQRRGSGAAFGAVYPQNAPGRNYPCGRGWGYFRSGAALHPVQGQPGHYGLYGKALRRGPEPG